MLVQVVYVFVDDLIDLLLVMIFGYLDVIVVLLCDIVLLGIYLVVDLFDLMLCQIDLNVIGEEYYLIICCVQQMLQCYKELCDIIVILGMDELLLEDKLLVVCVCKIQCFLLQLFYVVEVFMGLLGKYVLLKEMICGFKMIVDGECDYLLEQVFYMVGMIDEVFEKVKKIQ